MGKKSKNIQTEMNETLEENEEYLPLKYPQSSQRTKNKLNNFLVNSQDKNEASTSSIIYTCAECTQKINSNQSAIECKSKCGLWYHMKCSSLNKHDMDFFSKELKKKNGERWICNKCKHNYKSNSEELEKIIQDLQKSVFFMSEKFDKLEQENKEIFQILKLIKKEKENLKRENEILKKEIVIIKKETHILNFKFDNEEQTKLHNNIEIKGIKIQEKINDEEIIDKIMSKIGVKNNLTSIIKIERKMNHKKIKDDKISVTLKDEKTKNLIMKKSKEYFKTKGKITNNDIKIPGPIEPIYINEELTTRNKFLLGKAKEMKKFGFQYVWYKNGKIFVRKTADEQIKNIRNEDDIQNLLLNKG